MATTFRRTSSCTPQPHFRSSSAETSDSCPARWQVNDRLNLTAYARHGTREYRDKGFDIIGIALENARLSPGDTPEQAAARHARAKKVLNDFTARSEMDRPQYYDGKFWNNDLSTRFGIASIPAMFLIDKDGTIVTTDARGSKLEAEVKRLLGL